MSPTLNYAAQPQHLPQLCLSRQSLLRFSNTPQKSFVALFNFYTMQIIFKAQYFQVDANDALGQALLTNYSISINEAPDESQLTYTFGWQQKNHITFLHKSTSNDENPDEFDTLLPPGLNGQKLGITVDICNEQNSCRLKKTEVEVKPREISTDELK